MKSFKFDIHIKEGICRIIMLKRKMEIYQNQKSIPQYLQLVGRKCEAERWRSQLQRSGTLFSVNEGTAAVRYMHYRMDLVHRWMRYNEAF